jgi:hypothetical protein
MADNRALKQQEQETAAYRAFMQVAKRVQKIDYAGKWRIAVDPDDPLRKFTLDRDIGWATLKVGLNMKETYRRSVDWNDRAWYKPFISINGLFNDSNGPISMQTGIRLRPRLAKDLIAKINENIIPGFYKTINDTKEEIEAKKDFAVRWRMNIAKVPGLAQVKTNDSWRGPQGALKGCPFHIDLEDGKVKLSGEISYDKLAMMAKLCGWGEERG